MPITLGRFGRPKPTLVYSEREKKNQKKMIFPFHQAGRVNPSETSGDTDKVLLVIDWLLICLMEGHIEPSQPQVGRLCGWPQRPFFCESLYIDFECWCIKKDLLPKERASGKIFYSIVDEIFTRCGTKYSFPPLEECRLKFKSLSTNWKKNGE